MSETAIAKRINEAITQNGGYQKISEMTGISVSTLTQQNCVWQRRWFNNGKIHG